MSKKHIAIIVESDSGDLNPTLGIAATLAQNGYRISYATTPRFSQVVSENGAEARIYEPLDYRTDPFLQALHSRKWIEGDPECYETFKSTWKEFVSREIGHALPQIRKLYERDRPDLIMYDCRCLAGRQLAINWQIPKIEHSAMSIGGYDKDGLDHTYDDTCVIVSVPRFFQRNPEALDSRFHFVGPLYSERYLQRSWMPLDHKGRPIIIVSGATAGTPSLERFILAIDAFASCKSWYVVLSIGSNLEPSSLGKLPEHFEINRIASHPDMLSRASLFLGHGGQSSTLEALYFGVPVLAIAERNGIYGDIAQRLVELGLGAHLYQNEASADSIRKLTEFLLSNDKVRHRLDQTKSQMSGIDRMRLLDLIRNLV